MTEILQEAERVDREENERYGDARGDELPEQLRTREGRRAAPKAYSPPLVPEGKINVTDPDSREMRTQGQPNIQGTTRSPS